VLSRPKFNRYFGAFQVRTILLFLEKNSHYVVATTTTHDLPDSADAPFLEVPLAKSVPLVTGNIAHFPKNKRAGADVKTPAEFLLQVSAS